MASARGGFAPLFCPQFYIATASSAISAPPRRAATVNRPPRTAGRRGLTRGPLYG